MSLKQTLRIICILMIAVSISAEVPNTLNYQGRLTDAAGDPVADGAYLVKFIIYDASVGGTDLWNTGFQTINTIDGLFSYQLGSMVTLPNGIFSDTSRYLGLTVGVDPELSPRTRFVSSPYAYRSQTADQAAVADDAQAFAGETPDFYLNWGDMTNVPAGFLDGIDNVDTDWNNLTNVPAGFADGTDDEGLSQTTADAAYVNVTGDTMTGPLFVKDASDTKRVELSGLFGGIKSFGTDGIVRSLLLSSTYGELFFYDDNGIPTVDIGAGLSNGGFLSLDDPLGSEDIYLYASGAGNSTVNLPNNAIDNTEILDEPGIASGIGTYKTLTTATMQDLATITIDIPAPGYIYIIGRCWSTYTGSTGITDGVFQIDETAGGSFVSPYYTIGGATSASDASMKLANSIFVDRIYFKGSAGSYTFRFEGLKENGSSSVSTGNNRITAMYFPSSYGSVYTISPVPPSDIEATLVQSTNPDGSTSQGYQYDLRNLELKAKEAQLKAKEAELRLMKAQQQQNRQEQ